MGNTETWVTSGFCISGKDLDPADCTEKIGIEPTETGLVGNKRRPESLGKLVTSFWTFKNEEVEADNIDEGLNKILDILWPVRFAVRGYVTGKSHWDCGFFSTVTVYDLEPEYSLESTTMTKMSFFGLSYGLEIYDYSNRVLRKGRSGSSLSLSQMD